MASRSEDSLTARFQPLADADDAPPDRPSFDPAADTAASWLAKAARGDRGAFGRFVVLYQDRLFNTLLRLIGDFDEAGELTQEAFTAPWPPCTSSGPIPPRTPGSSASPPRWQ